MRKIKARILGWIYWLGVHLPLSWGIYVINRTWPWGKPTLDYLEFHLADHCNLNCAGCLHYAPFADKRFASLETVRRDFARLKELFANVRHIRIMGGEPLLHPDVVAFAACVRGAFPKSKIRVVTNGLLLASFKGLPDLAALRIGIDWTLYPPMASQRDALIRHCQQAGADLRISENNSFMARTLPQGGEGPRKAFVWCRERMYCPLLDSGRFYLCAPARFAPYYNRASGAHIFADRGIDIYQSTAREIMRYLMHPILSCSYCAAGCRHLDWKASCNPEDWVR